MRGKLTCALVVASLCALATPAAAKKTKLSTRARSCADLPRGVRLPASGPGWAIPTTWERRGLAWGTRDLVALIKRVAQRLDEQQLGVPLRVADLSPRGGGASAWHKTHRRGTDVDLIFFMLDGSGEPAPAPRAMLVFDADGKGAAKDNLGNEVPPRRFDVARNWRLVRALLEDRAGNVERILIAKTLQHLLLEHARSIGAPARIIERAALVMHEPTRAPPHDDHMHVRIADPNPPCPMVASAKRPKRRQP